MPTTIADYIDQAYHNINVRLRGHDKDVRQLRNLQIPKTESAQGRLWASVALPDGSAMTLDHNRTLTGISWTIPSGQTVYRQAIPESYKLQLNTIAKAPRDIGTWIIAKRNDHIMDQFFMPLGLAATYTVRLSPIVSSTTNHVNVVTQYVALFCELRVDVPNQVTSLPSNATLELRAGIV